MNFHRIAGLAPLLCSFLPISIWALPDCEAGTPNAMLQWASPKNWALLALGGRTDVSVTDSLTTFVFTDQLIGISGPGDLIVSGASAIRRAVLLQTGGSLRQSGASYVGSVEQDADADAYLNLARAAAMSGALCASSLASTIDSGAVNIADPSGNKTIYAEQRVNVINLSDLILTNGSLTLSSHFTDPPPTLIVNIFGTFRMEGGSKIVLDGTLDELHVLFNMAGPGQDVTFTGAIGGDGLPTTQISGILLAPMRNIILSPGLVNGTVMGGGSSITLAAGSQIISHLE